MSARTVVVEALTAETTGLPSGWDVAGQDCDPATITGPTAIVWTSQVSPSPTTGRRSSDVSVVVVTGRQIEADDALEDALDVVLHVLDASDVLVWKSAEAVQFAEVWPAYKVTVTVTTLTIYPTTPEEG